MPVWGFSYPCYRLLHLQAKGDVTKMEKPWFMHSYSLRARYHPRRCWGNGGSSRFPCDKPSSSAHALLVCSLRVLRVRLFTWPHSVWWFVALGAEGPRQEINPLEPSWLADFAGHQKYHSNFFWSETSILFFLCWPQRQAGKTPQMVTFTCSSCYMPEWHNKHPEGYCSWIYLS